MQVASTGAAWLTLAAFEGLSGINGLNVNFTTFTPDMPYTLALPIDVYGPGAQAPPPPATSNTSSQQTLTIALAVALPLAAVLLAAAALAFILRRRRRQRAAATAAAGGKQGFFGPAEPGGSGLPEGDAPSGSSQRSEEATKQVSRHPAKQVGSRKEGGRGGPGSAAAGSGQPTAAPHHCCCTPPALHLAADGVVRARRAPA